MKEKKMDEDCWKMNEIRCRILFDDNMMKDVFKFCDYATELKMIKLNFFEAFRESYIHSSFILKQETM